MSSTIKRRLRWFAFVATLLSAPAASSMQPNAQEVQPFQDGTVLVGFQHGTGADTEAAIVRGAGASEERVIGAGTHVLRVPVGKVAEKIALLNAQPQVRYAEPDYIVHADAAPSGPNDQYYGKLWGMKTISADAAWGSTTGSSGVVVGVVDTGVD